MGRSILGGSCSPPNCKPKKSFVPIYGDPYRIIKRLYIFLPCTIMLLWEGTDSSGGASPSAVVRQTFSVGLQICSNVPTTATTNRRYTCVRARLGDSAGSIPATCIAGYLFATDEVHVKQTDLWARANNVSYEALDDVIRYPVLWPWRWPWT